MRSLTCGCRSLLELYEPLAKILLSSRGQVSPQGLFNHRHSVIESLVLVQTHTESDNCCWVVAPRVKSHLVLIDGFVGSAQFLNDVTNPSGGEPFAVPISDGASEVSSSSAELFSEFQVFG